MGFKTPYSKRNKLRRLIWSMVWTCFARPFPRSMAMGWKRMLLRAFGAKIAPTAVVYATTKVFQPWLLTMDDYACLAFSNTSSMPPANKNADSGISSYLPSRISLKPRMVSLIGTYLPCIPVNFSATEKG